MGALLVLIYVLCVLHTLNRSVVPIAQDIDPYPFNTERENQ